jgi:hypothetical protein
MDFLFSQSHASIMSRYDLGKVRSNGLRNHRLSTRSHRQSRQEATCERLMHGQSSCKGMGNIVSFMN